MRLNLPHRLDEHLLDLLLFLLDLLEILFCHLILRYSTRLHLAEIRVKIRRHLRLRLLPHKSRFRPFWLSTRPRLPLISSKPKILESRIKLLTGSLKIISKFLTLLSKISKVRRSTLKLKFKPLILHPRLSLSLPKILNETLRKGLGHLIHILLFLDLGGLSTTKILDFLLLLLLIQILPNFVVLHSLFLKLILRRRLFQRVEFRITLLRLTLLALLPHP